MTFYSSSMPRRFGAGGTPTSRGDVVYEPGGMIPVAQRIEAKLCPDCNRHIPSEDFVAHREREHPPQTKILSAGAIKSKMRFGYEPEPGP